MNFILKFKSITILFSTLLLINLISSVVLYKIAPEHKTSLPLLRELMHNNSANDSWDPMVFALNEFDSIKDSSTIYSKVFVEKHTKFQYPPTSLLIYRIPSDIFNLPYLHFTGYYKLLSFICVFLIGLLSIKIYSLVLKNLDLVFHNKIELYFNYLLIFLLCCLFYPLTRSFHLGQIQTILTFFITLSLLFYLQHKDSYSGIFLGLVCLVKPHFIIVLIWSILRKKWSFFISSSITILFFGIISLCYFGFNNHLDYLNTLSFLSKHGESYYPNQSINGLFNRLFFNGNNLEWSYASFPPFSAIIYAATLISSLIFLCLALYKKPNNPSLDIIDFSIIILSITIASPIAWEHHYSIVFPIFIGLIVPHLYKIFENRFNYNWLFIIFIYLFLTQNFSILNYFSESRLNILQSYLFFSALLTLIILYKILFKMKNGSLNKNEI